jgi:TM2 domain-containing membrane protein YozV
MGNEDSVYDLGDIDHGQPRPIFGSKSPIPEPFGIPNTTVRPRAVPPAGARQAASGVGGGLAGSLSIFVPGLGQMIAGEIAWGLFYLTGVGFCAAVLWALLGRLEQIVPVLTLFDLPTTVVAVVVMSLAGLTVLLHVAAVLHAHAVAPADDRTAPHPIVTAIASLAIPGWGQLLAGHRRRAALFLMSVWVLGTAWLTVTPAGVRVLDRLGLALPDAVRDGWGPVALLAAPLILWVISVYDAAAGAAAERRR